MLSQGTKRYSEYAIPVLLTICGLIKLIMIQYALPYSTHVDESDIIKDPLKILLQYKEGSFQTSTNLFNHILVFWHFVTFAFGFVFGYWKSMSDYIDALSVDAVSITLSFRILCALLSLIAMYIWLKLFKKIMPGNFTAQWFIPLLFILNPVEINSTNFTKFDSVAFLFYAVEFYMGYHYFILKEQKFRKYIYLISFLAVATRIENIAFLVGYSLFDLWKFYSFNLRKYFNKELIKYIAISIALYLIITLNFIYLFGFTNSVSYTKTKTFEEGIVFFSNLKEISYWYYLRVSFYLFSPVILLLFLLHFIPTRLTEHNVRFYFLIVPFLIITLSLSIMTVQNVHYYLASSCFILFIGLSTIPAIKNKFLRQGVVAFLLIYFLTYDLQLITRAAKPQPNGEIRELLLSNTSQNDRIILCGIADLKIRDEPHTLSEQLQALQETGGSTGLGLKNYLKQGLMDSSESRNIFFRVKDYFWKNTKYANKWFIGMEIPRLQSTDAKYIVIFERVDGMHKTENAFNDYLTSNYTEVYHKPFHFSDPRLLYRNFYYFHSTTVYEKKRTEPS